MVLAIDIGNSEITLGLFDGDKLIGSGRQATSAGDAELAESVRHLTTGQMVKAVVLCSVVPLATPGVIKACKEVVDLAPLEVSVNSDTGLKILYDTPEKLGIDRLVNAAAVWSRYRKAVIVVDFGTATTFNAISGKGEYMGGAIFPGLGMSAVSLAERTARLPLVEPQRPARVIGRSTEECIHSALYYGYAGLVERMVARMKEEMGEDATVVATGGMAGTIEGECRVIDKMDPHLTLDGLRIILEREMAHHDGRGCETASSNKEVTA